MKFNSLIPELSVSDFEKSLRFYTNILGFRAEYSRQKPLFAFLSLEGNQIMIQEINSKWENGKPEKPFGRGINFQLEVKSIKPLLEALEKNKIKLFSEVEENWYKKDNELLGNKEFLVQDPDGYLLRFFEDIGNKKAN